jgi:hypothetical protein
MININKLAENWLKERNMDNLPYNQMDLIGYITEEITEGIRDDSEHESVDWRVDILIFIFHSLYQDGYDVEDVIEEGYKEVNSRKGNYDESISKFIKVITGKEYKANYSKCKRV